MDRPAPGRARIRITGNAYWARGAAGPPSAFAVEILAQAAAELLAAGGAFAPGLLAGVEEARWSGAPPEAGEELEVAVRLEARLGPIAKVRGSLGRQGRELFTACIVVRER